MNLNLNKKMHHLDLDTWTVPGQILTGKPPPGSGNFCKPAGTKVLISAVAQNHTTAIPGGAECHHRELQQLHCSMHSPEAYNSIT